jgi:hypothetical protein
VVSRLDGTRGRPPRGRGLGQEPAGWYVEAVAEGAPAAIEALIAWCRKALRRRAWRTSRCTTSRAGLKGFHVTH